jgi:hypothetical protein
MSPRAAPTGLSIRSYRVGFGDCFLLSFTYAGGDARHVLIDFGTRRLPKDATKTHMRDVAWDIARACEGHLHAVVVTHRHLDHHGGFTGEAGAVIAQLQPEVVIQPWTEDPKAKDKAVAHHGSRAQDLALFAMQEAAPALVARAKKLGPRFATLAAINEGDSAAVTAVERLAPASKHRYVSFGSKSGLEGLLPGVKVRVLGPPTVEQWAGIARQASSSEEYWVAQAAQAQFWRLLSAAPREGALEPFPEAERLSQHEIPNHASWFLTRIREAAEEETFAVLHALDRALNNTSVVLLFEVGAAKLLFSGDAQLESWEHALSHEDIARALAGVTLYKVGHHGSRNATPKTLWHNFSHRGTKGQRGRLVTLLASMRGVYPGGKGESAEGEVPRRTLVQALKRESECRDMESETGLCVTIDVPLRG